MQHVSDIRSNSNDQFVYAATKIGRSALKKEVFRAVYFGKTKVKTVSDIEQLTKLPRKTVLDTAKKLEIDKLIHQTKVNGEVAYTKDDAFKGSWQKILNHAGNKQKIERIPTKVNPAGGKSKIVNIRIPANKVKIEQVTIDDITSFEKVQKLSPDASLAHMSESSFKKGILKILNETAPVPKDWGGEKNDIYTTKLKIQNKRFHAVFALKGPGKSINKITPKHMGKNGDQIQRLLRSSAQVFFVQYWKEIDQSVVDQMEQLALAKSYAEGRCIYFGIIDGDDSSRLVKAYSKFFK